MVIPCDLLVSQIDEYPKRIGEKDQAAAEYVRESMQENWRLIEDRVGPAVLRKEGLSVP